MVFHGFSDDTAAVGGRERVKVSWMCVWCWKVCVFGVERSGWRQATDVEETERAAETRAAPRRNGTKTKSIAVISSQCPG